MTWSRRTEVAVYAILAVLVLAPVAYGITTDAVSEAGAEWEATPNGPTVYFDENRDMPSASSPGYDPFPASNEINITTSAGVAVYSGTANTRARIDTIDDGTWSNASELDVASGNLTINPDSGGAASVTGDADSLQLKTDVDINDGELDAIISGTGKANLTLTTNASKGDQIGLIRTDTQEALAVDVANANGETRFTDVSLSTKTTSTQTLGNLTIRDERPSHDKITGPKVTAKFFSADGESIANRSDANSDGEISMVGLPVDKTFIAQLDAPNYHQRTIIIEDLSQQETAFLLNTTATSVEKEFLIEDQTGDFDETSTDIIIQRAIDQSLYASGGFEYLNVAGDNVGSDRAYIVDLQQGTRYRILVQNDDGDVRQLGSFTPESSGQTVLDIGSVTVNQSQVGTVAWNATIRNTTSGDQVIVSYNDTRNETDTLWIEVFERGNRSNHLISNTTFTQQLGHASVSQSIPQSENETEWRVRITAERPDAEDFFARTLVTPRRSILGGLAPWLTTVLSLGLIWVTAGLFSQVNGAVGALVVSGMGGLLWFVGLAPGVLGVGVVILAMSTAALIWINDARDGGL